MSFYYVLVVVVLEARGNDAAVSFLEKLREKVKHENEARILCNTSIGTIRLGEKNFEETKVRI